MYQILVPIDTDEERVHTQMTFVAELPSVQDEYKVTLLHVSDEDVPDFPDSVPQIQQVHSHLENENIDTHVTLRVSDTGSPATEIVDVAKEVDADQIVMGGRKRTPTGKVLFGSVTQSVLLNTKIPTTITGLL